MEKKELLKQMQYFDMITSAGLRPDEYYLMCSIRDSISPSKINLHKELRSLWKHEWITVPGPSCKLTEKGMKLVEDIESTFTAEKKKVNKRLMTENFKEMIQHFIDIGPAGKLGHGRPWRSSPRNLEKVFTWFFKNYKYSWETIIKATQIYLQENEKGNHKYTQQSHYFVRKNDHSKLADYCENVVHDNFHDFKESHDEKIV